METGKETVSRFEHENDLMHYGRVNKRSLIALIAVCVTFIIITTVFVVAYTVREKNWLETISRITTPTVEVRADGVHQQPNP